MKVDSSIMNSIDNIYRKAEELYNDSKYLLIKQGSSILMRALDRNNPYNIDYKHLSKAIKSLVKLNILLDNGWKPDDNYITDKFSFVEHKIDKEHYVEYWANPMYYILDMDSTNDYNYLTYCLAYYYSEENIFNIIKDDYHELSEQLYYYYDKLPGKEENPFYWMRIIDDSIKSFIITNSMKALLNNADLSAEMPEEFIIELVKSNSDLLAGLSEESIIEFAKSKLC